MCTELKLSRCRKSTTRTERSAATSVSLGASSWLDPPASYNNRCDYQDKLSLSRCDKAVQYALSHDLLEMLIHSIHTKDFRLV